MDNQGVKYRVAVGTSDGIVVNQHFGRADRFRIYEIMPDNNIIYLEERKVNPVCQGGVHDDSEMMKNAGCLSDCKYVLVSKIGQGAANVLEHMGISPIELPGIIEESINRLTAYDEVQALFTF